MKYTTLSVLADTDEKIVSSADIEYITVNEFDDATVSSFYKSFMKLNSDPNVLVIPIVIASFGGQVHSLLGMLDIMRSSTKPISTIALGKAMSCGAVLLSEGTKGYRFAGEFADIMIHEVSSGESGKTSDLKNGITQTKRLNTLLMNRLGLNTKFKDKNYFLKRVKNNVNVDLYLSPKECKRIGIIDHITVPTFTRK